DFMALSRDARCKGSRVALRTSGIRSTVPIFGARAARRAGIARSPAGRAVDVEVTSSARGVYVEVARKAGCPRSAAWQSDRRGDGLKTGEPSQTAALVAFLRALGDAGISHLPDFRDPTARAFLPSSWAKRFARVEKRKKRGPSTMLEAA